MKFIVLSILQMRHGTDFCEKVTGKTICFSSEKQ